MSKTNKKIIEFLDHVIFLGKPWYVVVDIYTLLTFDLGVLWGENAQLFDAFQTARDQTPREVGGPWAMDSMDDGWKLPRNLLNGQKPTKKKTWNPEIRKFKWILLKFRWFI